MDIDIYDDLDDFHEQEKKKSKELVEWEIKYNESLQTIEELREEKKELNKKIKRIELNFQSLLDTAKAEIKRKDQLIAELRKEKDDICFRRRQVHQQQAPRSENASPKGISNKFVKQTQNSDASASINVSTNVSVPKERTEKSDLKQSEIVPGHSRTSSGESREKRPRRDSSYHKHDDNNRRHYRSDYSRDSSDDKLRGKEYANKRTNSGDDKRRERNTERDSFKRTDRRDSTDDKRRNKDALKRNDHRNSRDRFDQSSVKCSDNRNVIDEKHKEKREPAKQNEKRDSTDEKHKDMCYSKQSESRAERDDKHKEQKTTNRTDGESEIQTYFQRSVSIYDKRKAKSIFKSASTTNANDDDKKKSKSIVDEKCNEKNYSNRVDKHDSRKENHKENETCQRLGISSESDVHSHVHENRVESVPTHNKEEKSPKAIKNETTINYFTKDLKYNEQSNVESGKYATTTKTETVKEGMDQLYDDIIMKTTKNATDENSNIPIVPILSTPKKVAMFNTLFGSTPSSAESSGGGVGTVLFTHIMHILRNTDESVSRSPISINEIEENPNTNAINHNEVAMQETEFNSYFTPIVQSTCENISTTEPQHTQSVRVESKMNGEDEIIEIDDDSNCTKVYLNGTEPTTTTAEKTDDQVKQRAEIKQTRSMKVLNDVPFVSDEDEAFDEKPIASRIQKERIQILEDIRLPSVYDLRAHVPNGETAKSPPVNEKSSAPKVCANAQTNECRKSVKNCTTAGITHTILGTIDITNDNDEILTTEIEEIEEIKEEEHTKETTCVDIIEDLQHKTTTLTETDCDEQSKSENKTQKIEDQLKTEKIITVIEDNKLFEKVQDLIQDDEMKSVPKISPCQVKKTSQKLKTHFKLNVMPTPKTKKRKLSITREELSISSKGDKDVHTLKKQKPLAECLKATSQTSLRLEKLNGMENVEELTPMPESHVLQSPEPLHSCVRRRQKRNRRACRILDSSSDDDEISFERTSNVSSTPTSAIHDPAAHLPAANISQDDKYNEIDSRLQSMFQSPPHKTGDDNRIIEDKSDAQLCYSPTLDNENNESIADNTLSILADATAAQSVSIGETPNDSAMLDASEKTTNNTEISHHNSLETKRISLGSSDYRFENVSENVVKLFITRKTTKRRMIKKKVQKLITTTTTTPTMTSSSVI